MMDNFKKINDWAGWGVFAIATLVYFLTLEPTASWWDCGEYIATAYKLQVGHPPGAPFFQIMGRFFSLFAFGDTSQVALMINAMSALSSSFTILFLFWSITLLGRKLLPSENGTYSLTNGLAILGAGLVGSLAYTFSDSFWFSAVEGEVYAMSSFFTALVFWSILRWEEVADQRHGYRWLLLIAYLIGLSIGVHMLNLLAIPAIVYVYYFKKYKKIEWKGFVLAGGLSIVILAFIMYYIIPGVVELSFFFEITFVNSFGLPFNSGTVVFFTLLVALIVFGLIYTHKKSMPGLNTIILGFTFILIGYSSFFMLIIRSNADVPIDENDPDNAVAMLAYLNREQYGSRPLYYGPYYNAPEIGREDGSPVYMRDDANGEYVVKDSRKGTQLVYDPEVSTVFPRMWSNQKASHVNIYEGKQFGTGKKGIPVRVTKRDGSQEIIYKPTFGQNLRFFFKYQLGHMYFRYFMWNFVGRQNDIESQGEIEHGNWMSGIGIIDKMRLGDQNNIPPSMENPARATFYFFPLILGLIGLFFHMNRHWKDAWVVFLLFLFTGIAIVVYLNQYPYQPRERDYAYAGSFYAFAIWIGLGVIGIYQYLIRYTGARLITVSSVIAISLLAVPILMAVQGWEGHDRSGKYASRDFAINYLESCEPNAILFTNGDNDTFPLWYAQEVEGVRTDVRVVNYMLASGDWYVEQMQRAVYESERLPMTIPTEKYTLGEFNLVPVYPKFEQPVELIRLIKFINNDNPDSKIRLQNDEWINYLPTDKIKLTLNKDQLLKTGTITEEELNQVPDELRWDIKQNYLFRNDLMLLDFLATNNWERPIYFANPNSVSSVLDLDQYMHMEGVVYRLRPVPAKNQINKMGGVDTDATYEFLTKKSAWGRLNQPDVTVDRESARNSLIARQTFMRSAEGLVNEGRNDSAVEILNLGLEYFPLEKFPPDVYMMSWADIYYRAGDTAAANTLVRDIAKRYNDDLSYYNKQRQDIYQLYSREVREAVLNLQRLSFLAREYKQEDLSKELDEMYLMQSGSIQGL